MHEEVYFGLPFLQEFGANAEFDGLLNWDSYQSSRIKIMWILKEYNWGDDGGSDQIYPASKVSKEELESRLKIHYNRMQQHYSNVAQYNRWKASYAKLLYVNYGILENVPQYTDMEGLDQQGLINGINYMEPIIVLNLKKVPGYASANMPTIRKFYNNHKEYVLKQINVANPDIIINGSGINELGQDVYPDGTFDSKWHYTKLKDKLVINAYHPNARVNSEEYVNRIVDIALNKRF